MKYIILILLFWGFQTQADILEDFDSLGTNKVLLEKAQVLVPEKKIEIVQGRIVNRNWRQEFSTDYEVTSSGANPYFFTQALGLSYQLHINPYWSIGLKYNYAFNKLSAEGDKIITDGRSKQDKIIHSDPNSEEKPEPFIPEMNWLKQSYLATVNWYPIYGKFKFLNSGIVHFDIYTHLAIGQAELRFNDSPIYQLGLGTGFWWSQHLSSRLEYKFTTYTADFYEKEQVQNMGNVSLSMGYLL
ncbi:MAG: outer membrane beta-barrel domain-containing protein [Bdellovibrionaceae bacterium]|nr:outer membrane beta-barrel domain-containing protein [Pseudobdellovibrionaceae bacterium]